MVFSEVSVCKHFLLLKIVHSKALANDIKSQLIFKDLKTSRVDPYIEHICVKIDTLLLEHVKVHFPIIKTSSPVRSALKKRLPRA